MRSEAEIRQMLTRLKKREKSLQPFSYPLEDADSWQRALRWVLGSRVTPAAFQRFRMPKKR